MKRLRPFSSFILVLLGSLILANSAAAITLEELQQIFSQKEVVRAQFKQERHISGMAQPLKSAGEMLMSKQYGLWWQQNTPFSMTLVLTDKVMVQTVGKQAPEIITAQNDPQLFQFNSLLQALFTADQKVLTQNFDLDLKALDAKRWQLHLAPHVAPLDKIFSSITLFGRDDLQKVEILDKQGDRTVIEFTTQPLNAHNKNLSAEERAYFKY